MILELWFLKAEVTDFSGNPLQSDSKKKKVKQ